MPLHPDLQRLEAQYENLLRQVDIGALSVDSAFAELERLRVQDASGAVWSVSPDHEPPATVFLRALPGSAPLPTDPSQYLPRNASVNPDPQFFPGGWQPDAQSSWRGAPPGAPTTPGLGPNATAVPDDFSGLFDPPVSPRTQMPSAGYPGDVPPGAVPPGAVPPGRPTPIPARPYDEFGAEEYAEPPRHKTTVVSRVVTLVGALGAAVLDSAGSLWRRVTQRFGTRTVVIALCALAVLVGLFVFTRSGSGPSDVTESFSYRCPEPSAPVAGVTGEENTALLGCLDASGLAGFVVSAGADGKFTLNPTAPVPLGATVASAVELYQKATNRPVPPADVALPASVPAQYVNAIKQATTLKLIDPTKFNPAAPTTRGDLALEVYSALRDAGVAMPTGSPASDAAGMPADYITAQSGLAAAGILDVSPGAPYRFKENVTASNWVTVVGRALYEVEHPGAMEQRRAAQTQSTSTPSTRPSASPSANAPDAKTVNDIIAALVSGDVTRSGAVVAEPGDAVNVQLQTAALAGYKPTGLTLKAQPATKTDAGARALLDVVDASGKTIAGATLELVTRDGKWLAAKWPAITRR